MPLPPPTPPRVLRHAHQSMSIIADSSNRLKLQVVAFEIGPRKTRLALSEALVAIGEISLEIQ